jgi:hypothetical protein
MRAASRTISSPAQGRTRRRASCCGRIGTPAALLDELDPARPVTPVRLLGEDFVLFRDEAGRYGMLDRDCPIAAPTSPSAGSRMAGSAAPSTAGSSILTASASRPRPSPPEAASVRASASAPIRSWSGNGILFAYLGEGEPARLPGARLLRRPGSHAFAFKGLMECNWLQALEVGIDPAHASSCTASSRTRTRQPPTASSSVARLRIPTCP